MRQLLPLLIFAIAPIGASAQIALPRQDVVGVRPIFCPEGRTSTGDCVNPRLAQLARLTACIATQSRISASAGLPCTSVQQDNEFRYPNALFADTKRDLDLAFGRRTTTQPSISSVVERAGPGTPNPFIYPRITR